MPGPDADRWRSRASSQQKRRKKWIKPSPQTHKADTLSQYSEPGYLVGGSTPDELNQMKARLGNGLVQIHEMSATEGLIYEMEDTSLPQELP